MELTWFGHSNFRLERDGVAFAIDPFFEGNPKAPSPWSALGPVNAVLLTHDHGDHVGQALDICKRTGASLGCIVELAAKLKSQGLPDSQVLNGIGFNIGGTVSHQGISVTMTQAHHSCESGVPVGFIVRLEDGYTVYHAGDTGIFSSMALWGKLYRIDLALLPIGGVFTMDAAQAAMATMMLRCRKVAPMHWGTFPVLDQNVDAFRRELDKLELGDALMKLEVGVPVGLVR